MIKLENLDIFGFEAAIRGMRNPMNSWEKSDSRVALCGDEYALDPGFVIGDLDHDLAMRLVSAGPDHGKFLRMITVYVDITAPLYWWKEFDTYKVGTVANSCSTMHKIQDKEFTEADFSMEHLQGFEDLLSDSGVKMKVPAATITLAGGTVTVSPKGIMLAAIIPMLNTLRHLYLRSGQKDKEIWYQMIQLLPTSYNQRRTVMLNYEVLRRIYHARKNHKLDEWRTLCGWIDTLPYSELITGED